MRLQIIQDFLQKKGWKFTYHEENGLGSLDFEARGLRYHVWEFSDGETGAESNVRTAGRQEDFLGNYEEAIVHIMESWHD